VALDACAEAGVAAGATSTRLVSQREVVQELAPSAPEGPGELLAYRSQLAELTDPDGLGAFTWLMQGVAMEVPQAG
jgi:hypothetical protein